MKKFLMAVAALALVGSAAIAGPNAGGTIFVHNSGYVYDGGNECGLGTPPASCAEANTQIDGSNNVPMVWKIYAAFAPCTAPRLKAMSLGITYNSYPSGLVLYGSGPCIGDTQNGAQEYPSAGWPASGGGNVLVWQYTQTTTLVEAYWFAGYAYYGAPSTFALGPNPDPGIGGNFADDSVPAISDPIAGYGVLGFNQPGSVSCPSAAAEGACCNGDVCTLTCEGDCQFTWHGGPCDPNPCQPPPQTGACCIGTTCYILTQADCLAQGGTYHGDGSQCTQDLCAPVPVQESTWGKIKAQYR